MTQTLPPLLDRALLLQKTESVAKALLGKTLVRLLPEGMMAGKIVETEAYIGELDPASHASSANKNGRIKVLYEQAGLSYTYRIHQQTCFNVVAEEKGRAGCILIRALEPLFGVELMQVNRPGKSDHDLTNGPGKLCQAMAIDMSLYGMDLLSSNSPLQLREAMSPSETFPIMISKRIGISKAIDWDLRFTIANSLFLSRK